MEEKKRLPYKCLRKEKSRRKNKTKEIDTFLKLTYINLDY